MSFRRRENGKSTYKKAGFRKCTVKDFEDVNFKIDEADRELYEARFCPDITEDLKEDYKVYNGYTDASRKSFAVEIIKCTPDIRDDCKPHADIQKVVDEIYFTFYYLEEYIQWNEGNEMLERPITTRDVYHS